jgi:lysophospholipase L1-like esterase
VRLSRRGWFAVAAVALGIVVPFAGLLSADVYVHHKFERGVLYNVWGYRGPAVARKAQGEYRVAVLGGSVAYGFGVRWDESMPALLEARLRARAPSVVVNLAYNGQGAYAFVPTMDDYAYLGYDAVLLYESYNDLLSDPSRPTRAVFRRESPMFRLTGYLPVFSIVAREKASVLLYGDTRAVYAHAHHAQTVFMPGLASKASAQILQSAAAIGESLERQFGHLVAGASNAVVHAAEDGSGCSGTWVEYCRLVYKAIRTARHRQVQVIVVTPPYALGDRLRPANIEQQSEMADMISREFGRDHSVTYVNLGEMVDLSDPALSFDRMHLTADGNARIADALTEPVLALRAGRLLSQRP